MLAELADNVDAVAVVTFDAVLEWLILSVSVFEVEGLLLDGREQKIGADS